MNCIIVDDEPHAIEVLQRYVEQTPSLSLKGTFRNPLKALTFLQQEHVDLIFLDVNMPNLTGIQFLKSLPQQPLIIFTTAYSTYAAESYEWNAVDYLVKPIVLERFLKAVNRANQEFKNKASESVANIPLGHRDEIILLKSGTLTHRVRLSDIIYISKESNYLEVHLTDKKILLRSNMNDIFAWLPGDGFCRIHKSYVINLKHVETIESHLVKLGKVSLSLGASYRDQFLKQIGSLK
jgi:two-component system LytT family response regulator